VVALGYHALGLRFGGPATVRVQWMKHRVELIASCKLGHRPWAYWLIEKRLKQRPAGEAGELRAIRTLQAYRDDTERKLVHRRLAEITEEMHARRHVRRVA
jgi:hypothetical protein